MASHCRNNNKNTSKPKCGDKADKLVKIVKCDIKTEETCFDDWYKAKSCSLISDGGCPCREGLV